MEYLTINDYAIPLANFGKLVTSASGREQDQARQEAFEFAISNVMRAVVAATSSPSSSRGGGWGSIAGYFLGPISGSTQGSPTDRATWIRRGISCALGNSENLRATVHRFAQGDHAARRGELLVNVRALMVASHICLSPNPPSHLRTLAELRELGITFQDLERSRNIHDELLREGSLEQAAVKLFEGLVWSSAYMTWGALGSAEAGKAAEMLRELRDVYNQRIGVYPHRFRILRDMEGVPRTAFEGHGSHTGHAMRVTQAPSSTGITNVFGEVLIVSAHSGGAGDEEEKGMDESG